MVLGSHLSQRGHNTGVYPLWQIALVSILPGLLWLWFFYRQDAFEPEPRRLLLLLFGLGMLAVLPALLLELPWRAQLLTSLRQGDLARLALLSFAVVGGIEESVKTLTLYLSVRHMAEYDEPLDGIIYGVTVGLGFAALENLLYAYTKGLTVGLFRAVVTSLAHASFTGWLGYFVTVAKFGRRHGVIVMGLIVATILHGAYDFLLLAMGGAYGLLGFGLVGLAMLLLMMKIRELEALSPFRPR